ncbi:hypothetical protein SUGI_0959060 [Cryptomeria japonica]|uniref:uncharacterized protein LOC131052088 isoform X2 n=1 Tax=Cryptomeria japonica TaxID=3369 RepID=UPI00241490C5|nr:uncharacterized protein LOC131052088 isoform X2 [Cryptomeria japonica]GLJ45555.1 hypothetical protein SUGI_0959060 [Cryptomeria japonica]
MPNQVVSSAVTALAPTVASSISQPHLCCHARIKAFPSSCRNMNLEKIFSEDERLFCIPDHRQNYGHCLQAVRSDCVSVIKTSQPLNAAKTLDVQTILKRSVITEGSFPQDATIPKEQLEDGAYVRNQIPKTRYLVKEEQFCSGSDVIFHASHAYNCKNMLSTCGTENRFALGILPFASQMLFEDIKCSVAIATEFPDTISDAASVPSNTPSTENFQPATEEAPNVLDNTISNVPNNPSVVKELAVDPSVSTDSSPSTESTVNSFSDSISKSSESFSESKNMADFSVERTQKAFEDFIFSVKDSLDSSVNDAGNAVKDTYVNINESILRSMKSLTGSFENAISGLFRLPDNTGGLTTSSGIDIMSPFQIGTPANNAIKKVVVVVEDSAGAVFAVTSSSITEIYRSTKGSLPFEAQSFLDISEEKASAVIQPIGSFIQQINVLITETEKALGIDPENPIIPVVLVIGGTIFFGVLYWGYKYGGYSGDLTPKEASDVLRKEGNTVLIDIRPQEMKESNGIPDLRRGERFKFAAVEFPKVEGSVRKLLKNANAIDDILTAAVIKNLKIVNGSSKVLIMDANGVQSKKVARALRKLGIKKPYRIKGGFQSWVADGLRVKEMKMETPLTILKEDTEAIIEETRPTPGAVFAVCVGIIAGINALLEWEKTLQLIGFIGLAQVVYRRISSYENSDDLKADIRAFLSPFQWATQGALRIAGKVQSKQLQLATSPSTTAVQNRVLQAAAKHSLISSELEQTQDQEPISDLATASDNTGVTSEQET